MAFVTAYFDESYASPNPSVYTVGGYISTDRRWVKFQKAWMALLNQEVKAQWRKVYGPDKPLFFHMTDFANPHDKIYGSWKPEKKTWFLRELHKVIKKTYIRSFASGVIVADYDALSDEQKYVIGSPHMFVSINCAKQIAGWAEGENRHHPITLNKGMMAEPDVDKFKVWPTQLDRVQFTDVIISNSRAELETKHALIHRKYARKPEPRPRMVEAYLFFYEQIEEFLTETQQTNHWRAKSLCRNVLKNANGLGATPARVRGMLLTQSLLVIAVGAVLGVAGASAVGRFFGSLIPEAVPVGLVTSMALSISLSAAAAFTIWFATRCIPELDITRMLRAE